MDDKILRRKIW